MDKRRAGIALASALMVIFMAMTIALSLAACGAFNLHLTQNLYAQEASRNLANAAIFSAINEVQQNQGFGTGRAVSDTCIVPCSDGPIGSQGWVTFDEAMADADNVPWSTNLSTSNTAGQGWHGRSIPSHAVHLVGIGDYGKTRVLVEAVVALPPFPYSIAASGTLNSGGSLLVGAVDPDTPVDLSTVSLVSPDLLLPGSMASNSTSSSALVLGQCHVTGDITSAGGVQVAAGSQVDGSVSSYQQPVPLPSVDVPSLVASAPQCASLQPITQPVVSAPTLAGGVYQFTGPLLTIQGDLTFNQGVLVVQGDLHVTGGIKGTGAVMVSGNTTIDASSKMASDDTAAILSGGAVTLDGGDMLSSSFQGLVYAGGAFKAQGMTLLGSFVANGGQNSDVTLTNTRLVQTVPLTATTTGANSGAITEVAFGNQQVTITQNGPPPTTYLNFTDGSRGTILGWNLGGGLTSDTSGGAFINQSRTSQSSISVGLAEENGNIYVTGPNGARGVFPATSTSQIVNFILQGVQNAQPQKHSWLFGLFTYGGPIQIDARTLAADVTAITPIIKNLPITQVTPGTVQILNVNNHLFDFYFNEFISLSDQVRVLYWNKMDPAFVK